MYRSSMLTAIAATSLLLAAPSHAATLVSTELVLSVDVSGSIDHNEFRLQQQGYADAFRDVDIIKQISNLRDGLAVNMQFWATSIGDSTGWFHITDAASSHAFADATGNLNRYSAGSSTNIAGGIDGATNLILNNDFEGRNKVIDVSGDGYQNVNCSYSYSGFPDTDCNALVSAARDNAVNNGMTINGFAIQSDVATLGNYFNANVKGGDDAFVVGVADFDDFGRGIKTKIKAEITPPDEIQSVPEPLSLVALAGVAGFLLSGICKRSRPTS